MPLTAVNGVRLYSEWFGEGGPSVVLVHGSWVDHHSWDTVVPALARTFRVLAYDRRGHSRSERLPTQGSIEEDAADLAALITGAGDVPVHVVGNSFGASIALKLATTRPELFASLVVHEPPLIGLLGNDPALAAVQQRIDAVIGTLRSGGDEAGARQFVDTVALGPGMWDRLPPDMRQTCVFNASTWVDEMNEPGAFMLDLDRLRAFDRPVLLSQGGQSPPFFGAVLDRIAAALPYARRHTFPDTGHAPHLTHPDDYVAIVTTFIDSMSR
jgi:pimeloyl-ACP methyl ester carboxylesterase